MDPTTTYTVTFHIETAADAADVKRDVRECIQNLRAAPGVGPVIGAVYVARARVDGPEQYDRHQVGELRPGNRIPGGGAFWTAASSARRQGLAARTGVRRELFELAELDDLPTRCRCGADAGPEGLCWNCEEGAAIDDSAAKGGEHDTSD
jgi:hypothetical protein